jgi:hypothetical protein
MEEPFIKDITTRWIDVYLRVRRQVLEGLAQPLAAVASACFHLFRKLALLCGACIVRC